MAFVKISAQLDRSENHTPWGFRMSGGKDFAASLVVQKVCFSFFAFKLMIQLESSLFN